jgi:hypothetical protein
MEVRERCNAIEECYEFMLGFAAKGVPDDSGTSQLRDQLRRAVEALSGLAEAYRAEVAAQNREPQDRYHAFLRILDRDATDAKAAMELVLSLPLISSQVIDNLNALIHLRALLTDLFLIDEILRPQRISANPAPAD